MTYRKLGLGLGYFSVALGAIELAAPGRLARMLGIEGEDAKTAKDVIRAFGLREIGAGVALIRAPEVPAFAWNRVAGDVMDAAALGLALPGSKRKGAVAGALAFVGGALALDVVAARGLDRERRATQPALA